MDRYCIWNTWYYILILFKIIFASDNVDTDAVNSSQSTEQARQSVESMSTTMITGMIVSIIGIILALIAIFLIKKSRIASGVLLIIAGIVFILQTGFVLFSS